MRLRLLALPLLALALTATTPSTPARAGTVSIHDNQLFIDGKAQPQLFGAELQYFRLRGGQERNIPRAKVVEIWARALDKMVEAKMNAISFYIPWDFHEYAEGKFDFTGTVDEDGDGNPDYPSRDIFTFFKMIEERGIKTIMARPGPYINAEWGFLGFGAVPRWFHEKYPDSHMISPQGNRNRLYAYDSPEFHEYTRRWFRAVYEQVLQHYIGPGKPVSFLQIDNETNYMWQSIYAGDYSTRALTRYRAFLKSKYQTLANLNRAHNTTHTAWAKVDAPRSPGGNRVADADWYEFQDGTIHSYLKKIRSYWEELGVREPQVLFTLAESYNAPDNGLLPHYLYRNDPGATGMMTVNLYPKTYDTDANPLFNLPFKADHDVKNAESASDYYLGKKEAWVMGPEIQGGWWRGVRISPEARRQTYLSTVGHGLKALFVYYFTEGDNWEPYWQKDQIRPYFEALHQTDAFRGVPEDKLPWEFWETLQRTIDENVVVGIPVHHMWTMGKSVAEDLFFDSPLDGRALPRDHYYDLKNLGEKLFHPYRNFLGKAVAVEDRVCIVRDGAQHLPGPNPDLNSILMNGEWSGGLLGYVLQTGTNPRIFHWGLNPTAELNDCDLLLWQDNGLTNPKLTEALKARLEQGATVVSFLEHSAARQLGVQAVSRSGSPVGETWVRYENERFLAVPALAFRYELADARCKALLFDDSASPTGYECAWGNQGKFVQIGALPYQPYNSDNYGWLNDSGTRLKLLRHLFASARIHSALEIPSTSDRTVAFARTVDQSSYWITAKTGSPLGSHTSLKVKNLNPTQTYRVRDLLSGWETTLNGAALTEDGFPLNLGPNGSTVYFVEKAARRALW